MEFYFMRAVNSGYYTEPKPLNYGITSREAIVNGELTRFVGFDYKEPYQFSIKGTRLADYYSLMEGCRLISLKALTLFDENGVKHGGYIPWTCIEWKDRKGKKHDPDSLKYYMLRKNNCGNILDLNGAEIPSNAGGGADQAAFMKAKGFSVNMELWDGCDIFTFSNLGEYAVTEKVKKLAEDNKLTNFSFRNIKEPWQYMFLNKLK